MNRLFPPLLFALCSVLIFAGCSLPRLIILKDPLTPQEHVNLGVAYEKQGDLDNAIKEYRLAAKKSPQAYLYLGNAYFQKQDWKRAEEYYQKGIQKEPDNADLYNNLAWLYYTRKENLDRAEKLARKAIDVNPEKVEIYRDTLEKIREVKKAPP